jgi:hypothetical protein
VGAFTYIHNNPAEVGLPAGTWTSYDELTGTKPQDLAGVSAALDALDIDLEDKGGILDVLTGAGFHKKYGQPAKRLERLSDTDAIDIIKDAGVLDNFGNLAKADQGQRDLMLAQLRLRGLSIRQISGLPLHLLLGNSQFKHKIEPVRSKNTKSRSS